MNWISLRINVAVKLSIKMEMVERRKFVDWSTRIWIKGPIVPMKALQNGLHCCKSRLKHIVQWHPMLCHSRTCQTSRAEGMVHVLLLFSSLGIITLLEIVWFSPFHVFFSILVLVSEDFFAYQITVININLKNHIMCSGSYGWEYVHKFWYSEFFWCLGWNRPQRLCESNFSSSFALLFFLQNLFCFNCNTISKIISV